MDLYNLIISAKLSKGEGGDVSVDPLSVTENGTYTASSGHAYSPVTVSVPTGVVPSGTSQITSNGMYDVTNFASASVNVPGIVPSGTSSITANGIYDITSFASVDVNVSGGGGGGITADEVAMRTISGAVSGSATSIGSYAFANCSALTTASFPNATMIGDSAFYNCSNLTTANCPSATSIGSYAFANCSALTMASFPNVTSLMRQAFEGCRNLSQIYLPLLVSGDYSAFRSCASLEYISFPELKSVGPNAFDYCTNVSFIDCPKLETVEGFMGLTHITEVSFPNASVIRNVALARCTKLESIYLLGSSVVTLYNENALQSTPLSASSYLGYFGSIYVPASLVDSYKSSAGWSVYSDRITAYEG